MTSRRLRHMQFKKILLAAAISSALPALAQGVLDLGLPADDVNSVANGVSADGMVVVGQSNAPGNVSRAFVWRPSGIEILDPLTGHVSAIAKSISSAGDVIVGSSIENSLSGNSLAVRWTSQGATALSPLSYDSQSGAEAVSADGAVAVGYSATGMNTQAVRWVGTGPAEALGFLGSDFKSRAYGVNADGNVVVGNSSDFSSQDRAFRWTEEHGIQAINVQGTYSSANGVNADGNVVVGRYVNIDGRSRAFRWVVGNDGINGVSTDLGFVDSINHTSSVARAVNAAGDVVVGYSTNASASLQNAFRWTEGTGMQSVEAWLEGAGVTVDASVQTRSAQGVSADGSVVVGQLHNQRAFVARVAGYNQGGGNGGGQPGGGSGGGSGLIDVAEYFGTLSTAASTVALPLRDADPVLHGAHGSPMEWLLAPGKTSVRVAGDIARTDRNGIDSEQALGEFGVAHAFSPTLQAQFSLGASRSKQVLPFDGSARLRSTYVVPELIWQAAPGLFASFTGYYSDGSLRLNRGYLNAGTPDFSYGETDSTTTAIRARLDWRDLWSWNNVSFTPYTSLTHSRTRVDAYAEAGGGFAAQWDARKDKQDVLRLGLDGVKTFTGDLRLTGRVELGHRLGNSNPSVATGAITGLMGFTVESPETQRREWLRLGVGVDLPLGPGRLATTLNATTQGGAPAYWLAASYRIDF